MGELLQVSTLLYKTKLIKFSRSDTLPRAVAYIRTADFNQIVQLRKLLIEKHSKETLNIKQTNENYSVVFVGLIIYTCYMITAFQKA